MPFKDKEKEKEYKHQYYLKNKCEHNRNKYYCKECGGSQICQHNREKSRCKECGGSQICQHNQYKSRCKECDIHLYLVHLQRNRINQVLKQNDYTKTKSTIEYLDCSPEFFVEWMKSKFVENMSFDNIHIDHIKPVSRFNLKDPDDFLKCCHYTNLQPLFIADNMEIQINGQKKMKNFGLKILFIKIIE